MPSARSCLAGIEQFHTILLFVRASLQAQLVRAASLLNAVQERCLESCTLYAMDMARQVAAMPKRLRFVKDQEQALYRWLLRLADDRQPGDEQIGALLQESIEAVRDELLREIDEAHGKCVYFFKKFFLLFIVSTKTQARRAPKCAQCAFII